MTDRRYDLDWLRIAAFGLLILYHVGMFYVTWDWHAKSRFAGPDIEPLMLLTNPWRLTLLFFVSGVAMRFMADKTTSLGFLSARVGRLGPPLLLGMAVIVAPQTYVQVTEALARGEGLPGVTADNFYWRYLTASGNWCGTQGCITTPTWNHLWFVAYLLVYAILLAALLPLLRRLPKGLGVLLAGPGLFLAPWLVLFVLRATLFPIFGETHAMVGDWYVHAQSFGAVLLGYAVAKDDAFFARAARWRFAMLGLALTAWAAIVVYRAIYATEQPPALLLLCMRGVREAQAWAAILAVIGYFHHYTRTADGPIRRMLTHAVFPFYVIHQTIIIVAGHWLTSQRVPLWVEAPVLIAVTMFGCWLFFEITRRIAPLRIWVGLPSKMDVKDTRSSAPTPRP